MRRVGLIVSRALRVVAKAAAPGMTTEQLNAIAHDAITALGATPNFLHYNGFPASICISVNDEVVHGIPGDRTLQLGDLVSFDCGAMIIEDGKPWHGDSAITKIIGFEDDDDLSGIDPSLAKLVARRRELSAVTKKVMWAGIAASATAKRVGDIGTAIEAATNAAAKKLDWVPGIVEDYTGHGIGNALHEEPEVFNYRTRFRGPRIKPGLVICIEPMLTDGDPETAVLDDDWTVVTMRKTDSAHWEHTVAITDRGISVLTEEDGGKRGLAPFGIDPVGDLAN